MIVLAVAILVGAQGLGQAEVDTTGLVAYYPFSGNAGDSSGHGHDGTVYGATLTADRFGNPERAYLFDNSDKIRLTTPQALGMYDHDFTVAAWIKGNSYAGRDAGILASETGGVSSWLWLMVRNARPLLAFYFNDTYARTSTLLQAGLWYHIVFRYTEATGEQAIFINGELDTAATGHSPFTGYDTLDIGRCHNGSFDGVIDDVCIYERALRQGEIDTLAGYTTGLTAPLLITPGDSTILASPYFPVFTWHRVDSAEYYRYQLSSSSTFSSFYEDFTLTDTAYTPVAGPGWYESYFWRVFAYKGMYSRVSPVRTFQFGIPTLITPPMDSTFAGSNTPTFIWNRVDSASYYDLRVSTDRTMSTNFVIIHSLADTAYTTFSPLGDGHYYWQVKARGNPTLEHFSSVINHFGVNVYGGVAGQPASQGVPRFKLDTPYPNPARSGTTVHWDLPEPATARLEVYNVAGQRVAVLADGRQGAGRHSLNWDIRDDKGGKVPNGVYILRLTVGSRSVGSKVTVIR
jgi:hypothetical protein